MCASSARRRVGVRALRVPLGAVLAGLLLGGCSSSGGPVATATPSPTPMSRLETNALELPRIDFCSLVPDDAVADALGNASGADERPRSAAYGNGDQLALADIGRDRVQELGCSWSAGGTAARAWLFARPADAALARRVRAEAAERTGCRVVDAPFGRAAFRQSCDATQDRQRVRYAGLFDQTWLTCEVAGPRDVGAAGQQASTRRRAEQWCVRVASSLAEAR
ncbi:hypothetical protein SAMN04488570_0122 [Nocardioides scoriae]|uniref:DUF3558 domain-containing protein n=1 Tax=Nocardioides scoriae TaxID=642780 RepID=A0A1H1LAJ0_9ACTN|nr:hypothetical protein [Nocardioides scoriae]SDR71370.1 hypothetical protein SAMN04488570_0122 [Nocardioides scoriae]